MAIINFFTRLEKNLFKTLKKEIDLINNIFSLNKDKITLGELISFLEDSEKNEAINLKNISFYFYKSALSLNILLKNSI